MGHPHSTTFKSKPVWSVQLSLVCVCVCVVCRGVHVCSPWRANSGVAAALRCSDGGSYIRFPLWNKSRRAPVLLSPGPEPATTCHHQCSHLCWQQGFPYKGAWFFSFCMCVCAGVRVFGCVWVCVCAEKLLRQNSTVVLQVCWRWDPVRLQLQNKICCWRFYPFFFFFVAHTVYAHVSTPDPCDTLNIFEPPHIKPDFTATSYGFYPVFPRQYSTVNRRSVPRAERTRLNVRSAVALTFGNPRTGEEAWISFRKRPLPRNAPWTGRTWANWSSPPSLSCSRRRGWAYGTGWSPGEREEEMLWGREDVRTDGAVAEMRRKRFRRLPSSAQWCLWTKREKEREDEEPPPSSCLPSLFSSNSF